MALDEPNDTDKVFEEGGYTFCVNAELLTTAESIRIDISYMGFSVESGKPLGGGSSCGGCGSAGSCGS